MLIIIDSSTDPFNHAGGVNPQPDGFSNGGMAVWDCPPFPVGVRAGGAPLKPGHTYTISMTVESQEYKWSFKIEPDQY
jgi:hypothetical protein